MAIAHRWVSLGIGLALLVEVVSGVVLLFRPDLFRWLNPHLFAATPGPAVLTQGQAFAAAAVAHPGFVPDRLNVVDGVYQLSSLADPRHQVYLDPGSGRVLGVGDQFDGFLGFLRNLHHCALTCRGYPGYSPTLAAEVPWAGVQLGGLVLGTLALLFLAVNLSGVLAWWPGARRWARGLVVHWRRGTYRLSRDLHDVLGLVAIPFLLMWSVTAAGFEFTWVQRTWYAVTPGPAEPAETFGSTPGKGPDLGPDRALAAARPLAGDRVWMATRLPTADPAGFYTVGFVEHGYHPLRYAGTSSIAQTRVAVDRRTGRAELLRGGDRPWAQRVWMDWTLGLHLGLAVDWPVRLVWGLFGLAPVLLAWTGCWTWLARRRRLRRSG